MKVILTQEVQGRGAEGDVVDVARGFAVNYLYPRKMAIPATSGNLKQLEQRMHNIRKRDDERLSGANALADALEGKTVTIYAKVGEEGRLFGSITAPMVEDAIREQLGQEVDRRRIETHGHIKEIGERVVDVAIYRDVKAHVTVKVLAEGTIIEEPAEGVVEEDVEVVVVETEGTEGEATEIVDVVEDEVVAEDVEAAAPASEEPTEDEPADEA